MSIDMTKLLEDHLDSMWFTALRLTKDRRGAEDLVQEACLRAIENIDSLRSREKAKGWLLKILTNTFINRYRKGISEGVVLGGEEEFIDSLHYKNGEYIDLEGEIFSRVMDEEVKEALDNLPIEFRMAVLLVDIEELSYEEACEILGISSGTLASRLYRGRRLLRDSLINYARERGLLREAVK